MTLSTPVWIVALALAACAPWCVRALADQFELRVRKRTEALIARARARVASLHDDVSDKSEEEEEGEAGKG